MTTKKRYQDEIIMALLKAKLIDDSSTSIFEFLPSRGITAHVTIDNDRSFFVKKLNDTPVNGSLWLEKIKALNILSEETFPPSPQRVFSSNSWFCDEYLTEYSTFASCLDSVKHLIAAKKLGTSLARLHNSSQDQIHTIIQSAGLGFQSQCALSAQGPLQLHDYAAFPGLDRDMFLRVSQRCADAITILASTLSETCIVHGDLLGTNILLENQSAGNFKLIDWDRAGIGDPAWDLGHLFAALFRRWLQVCGADFSDITSFLAASGKQWIHYAVWYDEFINAYFSESEAHKIPTTKIIMIAGHALLERSRNILSHKGIFSRRDTLTLTFSAQMLCQPSACIDAFIPSLSMDD